MNSIKLNDFLLGLVLIILIQFSVIEVHFVLYSLIFIIGYSRLSKNILKSIGLLLIIFLIGLLSSFFQSKILYNFVKDFVYFSIPILSIISGYFIAKKIKNLSAFLKTIIYITALFSIIHIVTIFFGINIRNASVSDIRRIGGLSNIIEVFVLVILISSYKFEFLDVIKNKLLKRTIFFIIFTSFVFYFSRTMFISFLIIQLAVFGNLKITNKGLKYLFLMLLFFTSIYSYLFSVNIDRGKPGLESFLYKLKIAPSEIFTPIRKIDPKNHAYLWDHWRAYEATKAIDQINTVPTFFFGKGFGALIDLEISVYLGDSKMRYIPSIHNGYVYVFFKTGILGLLIYFIFLVSLYLYSYRKSFSKKILVINNLIGGIAIHFLFTSLIINGIYNIEEIFFFILGSLFFYRRKEIKSINKN